MQPIWISTEKVAELIGISERHVRRQLPLWEYKWVDENGKKVIKINVRSLPKEACDKYIEGSLPELADVATHKDDIDMVAVGIPHPDKFAGHAIQFLLLMSNFKAQIPEKRDDVIGMCGYNKRVESCDFQVRFSSYSAACVAVKNIPSRSMKLSLNPF